jgi:hypothetical protein
VKRDITVLLDACVVKLAKKTKKILAPRLRSTAPFDLRAINPLNEPSIKIPAQAAHLLVQILDEMSQGNAVKLIPVHAGCIGTQNLAP